MRVIVCVDDNMGMLFNKRRQSRDKNLIEDVMKRIETLKIHSFSEKLFEEYSEQIEIDDNLLKNAQLGEVCFVENQHLTPYIKNIEELIIYRWNRLYPSDFKLDIDLATWKMTSQEEFAGNSHEKITRETYVRVV